MSTFLTKALGVEPGVMFDESNPEKVLSAAPHDELNTAARALDAELAAARTDTTAARAERNALKTEVNEKRRFAPNLSKLLDTLLHGGFD